MNRLLLAVMISSLGLAACSRQDEASPPKAAEAPKAEAPKAPEAPVQAGAETYPPNTGKLVQILQAGGYTYGEVAGPQDQRVWIAGGHIDAQPGDMVQWGDFAQMKNYTSKSLNRTFETILFVNSWGPVGGTAATVAAHGTPPAAQAEAGGAHFTAISPSAPPAGGDRSGTVRSTTTAGGYTYVEVEQDGATVWVAAPETSVAVGNKVSWTGGMTMRNFNAKSLDRTFEKIEFAGALTVVQ